MPRQHPQWPPLADCLLPGRRLAHYGALLMALLDGLEEMGWLPALDCPAIPETGDTRELWQFLAAADTGDYLEFSADAWYSAEWQAERRPEIRETLLQRLRTPGDIDIVLAMGTWAGQDLATDEHHVPTLVMSVSDPVAAGIVTSAEDSGHLHVHCRVDPDRWRRQARMFHRLVGFKTLGVVADDTPEGYTYANIDDLRAVADEVGFKLQIRHAPANDVTAEEAARLVREQLAELAPEVDAVWLSSHLGMQPNAMPEVLAPLFEYRIPTWSTMGPDAVARGVLLSVGKGDFRHIGRYQAEVVAQVLNGVAPGNISQIYPDPVLIAVNLETAQRIGYRVPDGLIAAADFVYRDIESDREED